MSDPNRTVHLVDDDEAIRRSASYMPRTVEIHRANLMAKLDVASLWKRCASPSLPNWAARRTNRRQAFAQRRLRSAS
jgi:FixJ family two-component response regulator